MIRLYAHDGTSSSDPWHEGAVLALPSDAARHAQVRRVQPGDVVQVFDGRGLAFGAVVQTMGRREVTVRLTERVPQLQTLGCELPLAVTLAVGMPANERMDTLVEKATELGVTTLQPLQCERAVLKLSGERAQKKVAHWQAVAAAASEQCGRSVVPRVAEVLTLKEWLVSLPAPRVSSQHHEDLRWVLSLNAQAPMISRLDLPAPSAAPAPDRPALCTLSGPEGGLSPDEEHAAVQAGFVRVHLGARVLRADTAPLAVLAWLGLRG